MELRCKVWELDKPKRADYVVELCFILLFSFLFVLSLGF